MCPNVRLMTVGYADPGPYDARFIVDDFAVTIVPGLEAPPFRATLPYSEDFDSNLGQYWQSKSGTWATQSVEYRGETTSGIYGVSVIDFLDLLPSNLAFDATLRVDSSGSRPYAYMVFDYQNTSNFKIIQFQANTDRIVFGHYNNGTSELSEDVLPAVLPYNTDLSVTIELDGDKATLLDDAGSELLSHTYGGDPLNDGELGLGNWWSITFFDDIRVIQTDLPGDMNRDGLVNLGDSSLIVQALVDRTAYDAAYPSVNADDIGDVDGSGNFDLGDLSAFAALFGSGTASASASAIQAASIQALVKSAINGSSSGPGLGGSSLVHDSTGIGDQKAHRVQVLDRDDLLSASSGSSRRDAGPLDDEVFDKLAILVASSSTPADAADQALLELLEESFM